MFTTRSVSLCSRLGLLRPPAADAPLAATAAARGRRVRRSPPPPPLAPRGLDARARLEPELSFGDDGLARLQPFLTTTSSSTRWPT